MFLHPKCVICPYYYYSIAIELFLSGTNLSAGSIPSKLGGLTTLKWLYLNNFSSPIPTEVCNLINLEVLWACASVCVISPTGCGTDSKSTC